MNTATISFLTSFAVIIAMISMKSYELRTNKKMWLSSLADKTDHVVERFYGRAKIFFSYFNRHSAIALIQWLAYHILSWVRSAYLWIREIAHAHPPSKKVIDMVRGKGEIDKSGAPSFYIKKISEEEDK